MNVKVKNKNHAFVDIDICGVAILSVEEYEEYKNNIPLLNDHWWLRSPGDAGVGSTIAPIVSDDGRCDNFGVVVGNDIVDVRPALKISKLSGFKVGEQFISADKSWTIISKDYALCDDSIGKCAFREDWKADDANDYETSDVKRFVEDWYQKNVMGVNFYNISKRFSNGITIVNTTPHPINFLSPEGEKVTIPSSVSDGERTGFAVINASTTEIEYAPHLVETKFSGNDQGYEIISKIRECFNNDPNVMIVGSVVAANAYPDVVGMCPAPGYERVPPAEKLMSCEKFNVGEAKPGIAALRMAVEKHDKKLKDFSYENMKKNMGGMKNGQGCHEGPKLK